MRRHEYKRICRRLDHDPFDLDAQRSIDEWVVSIDSIKLGDREALMQAILVVIEACGGQSEEHQAVRAALLEVFCAVRRRDPAAASLLRQLPGLAGSQTIGHAMLRMLARAVFGAARAARPALSVVAHATRPN